MTDRRIVRISRERQFDFGQFQANYVDYRDWKIIPATDVFYGEILYYRSNAFGCKGEEISAGRPVVGVFGDSVVHGASEDSFPNQMKFPGFEVLNAGVEGLVLSRIIDRVLEIADQTQLVYATVHTGWHNLLYNERGESYWTEQLDRLNNTTKIAHFTLVPDLNVEAVELGFSDVMGRVSTYQLWGGGGSTLETVAGRREIASTIENFNVFIRRYCKERGRDLIDLAPLLAPKSFSDLGARFIDFIHPAPAYYAEMARVVEAIVAPRLPDDEHSQP